MQLRQSDDSDRLDPNCADASCTPFKTQSTIDGSGTKTYCFGVPGTSPIMSDITQVTIKLAADDRKTDRFIWSVGANL